MEVSIKNKIYQAILENKWLDITYLNSKNETTYYCVGIKDIDVESGKIYCDIFNHTKSIDVLERKNLFIHLDNIKHADILEHTYYESPKKLIDNVLNNNLYSDFLDVINYDNNILRYLSDCYRLDNDPYIKESVMINGVDLHTLFKDKHYPLNDEQFNLLLNKIYKKDLYEAERINKFNELVINKLSIDINDKQYVVAYKVLKLDLKRKTLKLSDEKTRFNKSFLIDDNQKVSLSSFLSGVSIDEFCDEFDQNTEEYVELLRNNFNHGEKINTRPNIFFIERKQFRSVDEALESIALKDNEGTLSFPLKSFFGRNRSRNNIDKDFGLVVYDKGKINYEQLRVIFNCMQNHTTYVKGPPGTGKTETIFNVLLSAYANDKTVLVCSNNNHPVTDIFNKMNSLLKPMKKNEENEIIFPFPIIRLGNNEETLQALVFLKDIYNKILSNKNEFAKQNSTDKTKQRLLNNSGKLKELLVEYEKQIEVMNNQKILDKLKTLTTIQEFKLSLLNQTENNKELLKSLKPINNEDLLNCVISANENYVFQNYLYYSSLLRYKKLLTKKYKDLVDIILLENNEEAVLSLNKYLKNDDNLDKFLSIFPLVVSTNLSCGKLGSPTEQFDLVIMDEAGQCNIASSLIPIVRAKDLLLIGDENQLQPVTLLETNVNDQLMEKYNINEEYNYVKNSILSTMLKKDPNSRVILLRSHYRCGKKIIEFSNKRFYENQLYIDSKLKDGNLYYRDVKNISINEKKNTSIQEANEIVSIIKENKYKDVGIITPFVNQAELINSILTKNNITDIKAGTIHTLQGSEKNTIIMSAAISPKTSIRTMDWIKNNYRIINVAVTRAKENLIFVGDHEAINKLSNDKTNDINELSNYIYNNGNYEVVKSDQVIIYDFSNNSKNEKEFFDTIGVYFNRPGTKFRIERNVPLNKAIDNIFPDDLEIIGKKEFDVIVQFIDLNFKKYKTIVAFEVDGGEHVGSKKQAEYDRQKEEICQKYGIKLIRIANSAVKDYELIISLFQNAVSV